MITSANTSVNKNKVPALFKIIDKHYGWKKNTKNLDIGGGKYDTATKWLKRRKVENLIFDPHNRDWGWNLSVMDKAIKAKGTLKTATLSNVLNVIRKPKEKLGAVACAYAGLKSGGTVYINVYEGNKSGKGGITKKDCWQENKPLKAYLPLVKRFFKNARIEHGIIVANK